MAKPPEADRHSSWSETQPCPELDCEKQQNDETTRSKYHKHAMALLLVYVPLITVPWALTCVMAKRPFTTSSFYVQTGLSARDITRINGWMTAINVINSIASVVTIPVISALVAQAAAVYAQKHRDSERFSLQHLTALADRGWLNPMTLTKSWTWRGQGLRGVRSFLYLATLVIFLGAIQQPLYQILAPVDTILVPTCHDARYMRLAAFNDSAKARCSWRKTPPAKLIGWDIEPAEMARISHTDLFNRISSELAVVSLKDLKAHLWTNKTDPEANRQPMGALGLESFAASLEQGSSTGVLREHIMRFNSSVNCQRIDRAQFPLTCAGKRPFQVAYGHGSNFTRVCVPGEYGVSPWNLTRNRQDFFEELFFDVLEEVPPNYGALNTEFITSNYTLHCTSTTTRGYFELGNYRNNYTWGPLLTSWPSEETMRTQFNDVIDYTLSSQMRIPKETDALALDSTWWNPFDLAVSSTWTAPGPLTMSAFALFGNKTFLESGMRAWNTTLVPDDSARLPWQQICSSIPFTRMDPSDKFNPQAFPSCVQFAEQEMRYATLKKTLSKWLLGFNDTRRATRALATSVYLVNEAMLTMHHWHPEYSDNLDGHRSIYTRTGRQIYEGAGMRVHKPKVSVTGMAIMTTLLVLQLAGLGVLAWLIYQAPSETRSLDALYVFNLIRNMPHDEAGVDDRGGRESKDEGTQLLGLTGKQGAMMRSQIRVL